VPQKRDYIIEMEKVRAAQNVIEKLYLRGDPGENIDQTKAEEIKQTYWEVIGKPPPEGLVGAEVPEGAKTPKTLNSWNC
jgi:hypothetical protein